MGHTYTNPPTGQPHPVETSSGQVRRPDDHPPVTVPTRSAVSPPRPRGLVHRMLVSLVSMVCLTVAATALMIWGDRLSTSAWEGWGGSSSRQATVTGSSPAAFPGSRPGAAAAVVTPGTPSSPGETTHDRCADRTGDGRSNDITSVEVGRDGEDLVVTWNVARVPEDSDSTGFYLDLESDNGVSSGQLGVRYSRGREASHFVFDFAEAVNTRLDGGTTLTGSSVTARFPMGELEAYGQGFHWKASTTDRGQTTDECPDQGSPGSTPVLVPFAG